MLVAYFDESGTHDHSKVVSVGGLLGDTLEWSRLQKPWAENLAVTGVKWFHAAECEEGVDQFQGISRPLRESLVNGLVGAALDRQFAFIGGSVFREDWNNCAPSEFKERFPDPYDFCVDYAIQGACKFVGDNAPGHRVAFVFAVPNKNLKDYVETVAEIYLRRDDLYPSMGSVTFSTPQEQIELQAADLFAFENYQYLRSRWFKGRGNFPIRPAFQRVGNSGKPFHAGFHDCASLRRLAEEYEPWEKP